MKHLTALIIGTLVTSNIVAQNKHPMKVAMVSVMVEDPVKAFRYYTEILGFEEVMFDPENYIAIVKSPLARDGATILLEPTEPGGIPIAKEFKKKIYEMGYPIISFSSEDIAATVKELKSKGVKFKKELTKTDWGYEAVFDDDNGNYIQIIKY
jgi:catechol 2,3-dioxygenase-like lactoylglutathione lyase family enzyme|tara:strand:+ start:2321 stop:2779 length:459 start_codon:yes stop_codon:yes gene_type:complete